jgi:hypothetical protein
MPFQFNLKTMQNLQRQVSRTQRGFENQQGFGFQFALNTMPNYSPKGSSHVAQKRLDMASIRYGMKWIPDFSCHYATAIIDVAPGQTLEATGWINYKARASLVRLAKRMGYTWFNSRQWSVSPLHLRLVAAAFELQAPLEEFMVGRRRWYSVHGPITEWAPRGQTVSRAFQELCFYCDGVNAGFTVRPRLDDPRIMYPTLRCDYARPDGMGGHSHGAARFDFYWAGPNCPLENVRMARALVALEKDERFPFRLNEGDEAVRSLPHLDGVLNQHQKIEAWKRYQERTHYPHMEPHE